MAEGVHKEVPRDAKLKTCHFRHRTPTATSSWTKFSFRSQSRSPKKFFRIYFYLRHERVTKKMTIIVSNVSVCYTFFRERNSGRIRSWLSTEKILIATLRLQCDLHSLSPNESKRSRFCIGSHIHNCQPTHQIDLGRPRCQRLGLSRRLLLFFKGFYWPKARRKDVQKSLIRYFGIQHHQQGRD